MLNCDRDIDGFYVLKKSYSDLYTKVNYTTPIQMIQNRIIEYDIKAANISMLRRAKVIKGSTLNELEALPKKERQILIGKMEIKNPNLKKIIADGILESKHELFMKNNILDSEVLSIKNDAIFIIGRKLKHTIFGEVEFRPKHTYSLYLKIEGIELYYDKQSDSLAVKGISDTIVDEPDHHNGMVRFFCDVMKYLVFDRREALREYLIKFADDYKSKRLPVCYYREFGSSNIYRTYISIQSHDLNLVMASDSDRDIINGVYNYTRYILPIIQLFI